MKLNKYIDHTILKRDAKEEEIDKIIDEAIKYQFKTICIHPIWISHAKSRLEGTGVEITTVFGFPFGTQTTETKISEAKDALLKGADELDMVMNVGKLHDNDLEYIKNELESVRKETKGKVIKLILETALLTDEEIKKASQIAVTAGWDFIKTSTGIGCGGATIKAVEIMKSVAGNKAEVKASGGVRSYEDAKKMVEAGATRIGTSNGVDIIEGRVSDSDY